MKSENRTGAATKAVLLLAIVITAAPGFAYADDFGPRGDVRDVRFAAQRLLSHSVRAWKMEPDAIHVSDAVVVRNASIVSWTAGSHRGLTGLLRYQDRWWDALDYNLYPDGWVDDASFPLPPYCSTQAGSASPMPARLLDDGMPADLVSAASAHIPQLKPANETRRAPLSMDRFCGAWRGQSAGYDISLGFAKNDAAPGSIAQRIYARAPTQAEMIPNPAGYHFTSNAVMYFDLTIDAPKPVTFAPGTTIDIWFPFVLDDSLRYDLTIGFADRPIGPIYSTPFDNVLHYTLPGFTVTPGRALMAEIDGNWH